jgi:hypothetical protein
MSKPTANEVERRVMFERYLDHEITHDEFYLWLADKLGYKAVWYHLPVPIKQIKASTDPHLNDIPLALWDAKHEPMCRLAWAPENAFPWSLCETVCVLKAVAKREAAQLEAVPHA